MTRPRRSTTSWLDSFEGEAIWPALPLPAVELYEEDLHARFEKLKAFLGDHLPAVDQRASQQPAAATEVAQDVMRVYGSPPRHFRARCRFGLGRDADGHMHYFVWNNADQCPSILADDYPAASLGIYKLMPQLLAHLSSDRDLSDGVRAVHFLTVKEGDQCVITLIYESPLKDSWSSAAKTLIAALGSGISIQGRSKGRLLAEGSGSVVERLSLHDNSTVWYKQVEGSFSNPNPDVNEKVLSWLCGCADAISSYECLHTSGTANTYSRDTALTLLELYCGNGNHTCALARKFRRIVGVEINPVLCQAADENLRLNRVENVRIFCSPSAAFCRRTLREKRLGSASGMREEQGQAEDLEFDSVLVDPPRAGLDEPTLEAVALYTHILYVSCGPDALKRDLGFLSGTHEVVRMAAFDHFPFTRHIESAVYLRRR